MNPPVDIAEAAETASNLVHLYPDTWLEEALLSPVEEQERPEPMAVAGLPNSGYWLCTADAQGSASITPVSALWLSGRLLFTAVPDAVGADHPDVFEASVAHLDRHDRDVVVDGVAERIDGGLLRRFLAAHEDKYGYVPELEENDAAVYAIVAE
jgi:hypothetical protein